LNTATNPESTEVKTARKLVHNRTGYVRGCRCQPCIEGNKEYQRTYMKEWRNKRRGSPEASSPTES